MTTTEFGREGEWLRSALPITREQSPFPWQVRLLHKFQGGYIPSHLDIPTGLGKTSVMAIWLVARALGAPLPRRLVYVVDRRAVVDQATEEAERLRGIVEKSLDLREALGLESRALPISTLRGQYADNREWLEDPSAPAIVVGTVDMIGSRMLFSGYGVSRWMRPYQAGLLGTDALVALDEAHLVPPFERLLQSIADGPFSPGEGQNGVVPAFRIMTLTATGALDAPGAFSLKADDFNHAGVRQRMEAKKGIEIRRVPLPDKKSILPTDEMAEHLANAAWRLCDEGHSSCRVVVFCHQPEVAEKAKKKVEAFLNARAKAEGMKQTEAKRWATAATEMLVGSRRVYERQDALARLRKLGFLAARVDQKDEGHNGPVFLFATSAGEVGVDLDADHMACDLVAWERMVQRLGRVNRRGCGDAKVVVVCAEAQNDQLHEVYKRKSEGESLTVNECRLLTTENRLQAIRSLRQQQGIPPSCSDPKWSMYDASPTAIRALRERAGRDPKVREQLHGASTPPPLHPALTRALVDAWSMTALKVHPGRPDVLAPWLRGWTNDDPQTTVLWRRYLPARLGGSPPPSRKEVEEYFGAAPPHWSEQLSTHTKSVADWLVKRAEALVASAENADGEALPRGVPLAFILDGKGDLIPVPATAHEGMDLEFLSVSWLSDKKAQKSRRDEIMTLVGHATVVVDARMAGLTDGRLNSAKGAMNAPLVADSDDSWSPNGDDHTSRVRFRVRESDDGVGESVGDSLWRPHFRFATAVSQEGAGTEWLIVERRHTDTDTEHGRAYGPPQELDEHQAWTERCARSLAKRLGLTPSYEKVLAIAARLHDEGKRAKRWQRAFNAPRNGRDYAKTDGPVQFATLDGYRHELGSLIRADSASYLAELPRDLRELCLHLVAAHHGRARPILGVDGCDDEANSDLADRQDRVARRFASLQAKWGPWGLAWWESLLRAADARASKENIQKKSGEKDA